MAGLRAKSWTPCPAQSKSHPQCLVFQTTKLLLPQFILLNKTFYRHTTTNKKTSQYALRQWPTWYTLALFYNTSTTILYMFRALHAHHQEVELYWWSIWYRPLSQWPSGAQVERELLCSSLSTCAPDGHWLRGRYQMLHQYNSTSWWWACNARNM